MTINQKIVTCIFLSCHTTHSQIYYRCKNAYHKTFIHSFYELNSQIFYDSFCSTFWIKYRSHH